MIVLRTLLAIALMLNGMAMPPAEAMHASAGTASHAGYHPLPASDGPQTRHSSADIPGSDCCNGPGCDCGCAVAQAATLPLTLSRTAWRAAPSEFPFAVKSFHSSPLAAPFRPPA